MVVPRGEWLTSAKNRMNIMTPPYSVTDGVEKIAVEARFAVSIPQYRFFLKYDLFLLKNIFGSRV
jgi:hypothetical protein